MDRDKLRQRATNAKAHAKRIAQDAKYPGTFVGLLVRFGSAAGGLTLLVMYAAH